MTHALVTSAIPFSYARADAVDAVLAQAVPDLRSGGAVRDALRGKSLHFTTITVVRGDIGEPTYLVFEISADGTPDDAWNVVGENLAPWIERVFNAAGLQPKTPFAKFLARHRVKTGTGLFDVPGLDFSGTPGMSVGRILDEYELAREIRTFLDKNPPLGSPLQLVGTIRKHIESKNYLETKRADLTPLLSAAPVDRLVSVKGAGIDPGFVLGLLVPLLLKFFWPLLIVLAAFVIGATALVYCTSHWSLAAVTFFTALIASFLLVLGAAIAVYLGLRRLEEANTPDDRQPDAQVMQEVSAYENWSQQNHLAGISIMQPGRLRGLTLRLAFWVIAQMAAKRFRPGFLGEINTIHFARWVMLPKTNKLLFFSNYGGSWESYLEDFITKASFGLTGVWSNTIGFPRARNLFQDGATDGDRFKRWARRQQQPTRFWYSAYPNLTTARIRTNAVIRQGLCTASTEDEAAAWLGLFGSKIRPDTLLETDDIQTLLFGGLSRHPFAACLLFQLPDNPFATVPWLASIEPKISFGDQPPDDKVLIFGLTAAGLAKLGLEQSVRDQFPTAFRTGMHSAGRSQILADTGDDKPAKWMWGGQGEADGAFLVYGADQVTLDMETISLTSGLTNIGGTVIHRIDPTPLPARKSGESGVQVAFEAFGFADGVSQPIVKGTRRWLRESDAIHAVEPGEFILGYPDSRGFFPPSPQVTASADPHNRLPLSDPRHSRGTYQPDFNYSGANAARDLGRNGSFLVIRQLEQNVGAFNTYLETAAKTYANHPAVPRTLPKSLLPEWIGAKIVGRWKNGTSLVRYPHRPGSPQPGQQHARPDNEFLYGAEDPTGERCPLGSHIRRTNPRDSLAPGSKDELSIVNRHRILRVGRSYHAEGSGDPEAKDPGLLFMCLNADIERQFEFIQQTWSMSWQFHGLENEADPILGRGETRKDRASLARLTMPSPRGPLHLTGFQDFVKVRGGAYFFMPGHRTIRYMAGI
ncbi:hypothetical protein IZ6_19870 [Terrihabitans soli]|uniref:Peroxidase n=1 Tax=Terrihabitans soli TaxID=708113 RepID=A0A6S6QVF3_9HYPH|nr:hypothetical protein [Terrihabitans soli]BCJ91252.1 hypothetical protein IZ6_19870 [Terrihabitans soli]